jgi:hypothetical protein
LLINGYPMHSESSTEVTLLFNLENHYLCYSHCLLSKGYFQHFKSFGTIFPKFKAELDADTLFFQVCHFLGTPKLQMEQYTVLLNKTSLNNHTCHSIFFCEGPRNGC